MAGTTPHGATSGPTDSAETIIAEVGDGPSPSLAVPESVGAFQHRPVPNTNTTTWARSWEPTADSLPKVRLSYKITCEHDIWEIVRSTVLRTRSCTSNMPHNQATTTTDVRDVQRVARAQNATHAREVAIDVMRAASALPDHTPPVVNRIAVASFYDLQRGGNGSVAPDDVDELVGNETETPTGGYTEEQKELATEHIHDPLYIGVDGEGGVHFWSAVHQTAVVVDEGQTDVFALEDTPLSDLGEWVEHVQNKRGEWVESRVDSHIGDAIRESLTPPQGEQATGPSHAHK